MATINGTAGNDTLNGTADADTISGLGGNDTIFGNNGNDTIDGGTGGDTLVGGLGDDGFVVDDAGDVVIESADEGSDTVTTSISYSLTAGSSIDFLVAATGTAAINLNGNGLVQTIVGNAGANVIDGGFDIVADTMQGGAGDDTYLVRTQLDLVIEAEGGGENDRVFVDASSGSSYILSGGQEIEFLSVAAQGDSQNFNLTGNDFDQTVVGNFGNNVISGGSGVDNLIGLEGDDTYIISSSDSTVIENGADDFDVVLANVSYTLTAGAAIEVLSTQDVASTVGLELVGNEFGQQVFGNAGANVIDGGGGTDALFGFGGNDFYFVDSQDDTISEAAGDFQDIVFSEGSYIVADGVAVEVLADVGLYDVVNGSSPPTADDDGTLDISSYGTTTTNNNLEGNEVVNLIFGSNGNNIINFGGVSTLSGDGFDRVAYGLDGDDIYRVYGQEDYAIEDNDGGFDSIFTSADYSLLSIEANIGTLNGIFTGPLEIEYLSVADGVSTDPINLTGNAYAQTIVGNFGDNIINGQGGADTLIGLAGNDTYVVSIFNETIQEVDGQGTDVAFISGGSYVLNEGAFVESLAAITAADTTAINIQGNTQAQTIVGNQGANILNSGGGAGDTLIGLDGDDTYRVYGQQDVIVETGADGSLDRVFTSADYRLDEDVAIDFLSAADQASTVGLSLGGNSGEQLIIGTNGADILNGYGDADSLQGLGGNDQYRVYGEGEVVIEAVGGGNDIVFTDVDFTLDDGQEIETLSVDTQTSTTSVDLRGNDLDNTIIGNDGNNTLAGAEGNDTLIGRGRADNFLFDTALDEDDNVDTIDDFNIDGDIIQLDTNIFAAVGGMVDAEEFVIGTAALEADDFLIYNSTSGELFYDADGNGSGAATLFAILDAGIPMQSTDFQVVGVGPVA